MKKMNKFAKFCLTLLSLVSIVSLSSCSDDDDEITIIGTWASSWSVDSGAEMLYKEENLIIREDGTYSAELIWSENGDTIADMCESVNGSYVYTDSTISFSELYPYGGPFTVEVSNTTLVLYSDTLGELYYTKK